jgi:hypothetical protein
MWGIGATTGWADAGPATIFIAVDHFVADCVGIHAARRGIRFEALEPPRQGFIRARKERVLWIERSETVETLRLALLASKDRYNPDWLIECHGHQTLAAVRAAFAATAAV